MIIFKITFTISNYKIVANFNMSNSTLDTITKLDEENLKLHRVITFQRNKIQELIMSNKTLLDDLYLQTSLNRKQEAAVKELLTRNENLTEQIHVLCIVVDSLKQTENIATKK
jgi:hypothetical protein